MSVAPILGALGFMTAAVVADGLTHRYFLAALALALGGLAFFAVTWVGAVAERTARYEAGPGALRFVPRQRTSRALNAMYAASSLPALVLLFATLVGASTPQVQRPTLVGVTVMSAFGLAGLFQHILAMRTPRGLTIDAAGLRGVRGTKRFDIGWSDITHATLSSTKNGARLVILTRERSLIAIQHQWFGSDPNVVAPIIEYYRQNPGERWKLADPHTAIRTVEEATTPTPDATNPTET